MTGVHFVHIRLARSTPAPATRDGTNIGAYTNPVLFTLGIGMLLAWKVAGYIGIDRVLLPKLGAPWNPGTLFRYPQPSTSS